MAEKNYYSILEVSPTASDAEVKASYRKLARMYHPDSDSGKASEFLFKEINEAYDILGNLDKRAKYDKEQGFSVLNDKPIVDETIDDSQEPQNPHVGNYNEHGTIDPSRFDMGDGVRMNSSRFTESQAPAVKEEDSIIKKAFGSLSTKFKGFEKASRIVKPRFTLKDEDQRKNFAGELRGEREFIFTVDCLESLRESYREIAIESKNKPRVIRVKIPAGVHHNAVLKVNVGHKKHVLVRIRHEKHPLVERDGYDIILKMPISYAEAIDGTELNVPTLDGPIKVALPPFVNKEKRLRLKGRGLKDVSKNKLGDLYVDPYIVPPDSLNEAAKQAVRSLDSFYSKKVRKKLPKKL